MSRQTLLRPRGARLERDVHAGQVVDESLAQLEQEPEQVDEGRRLSFLDFSLLVPEAKVGRLDFDRFVFLLELYSEAATYLHEIVVRKASQVGVSTWLIRWVMFFADQRVRTGFYVFPTKTDLGNFSRQRIRPAIRGSEYLLSRMTAESVDNNDLKQIGPGYVNFRGSESEAGLQSIDADVLVLDEYDLLVADNIGDAEQRVTGPMADGFIRRVGNPSLPGVGISVLYEESDQRVWHVDCRRCHEANPMLGYETFDKGLDKDAAVLVCRACGSKLDVRRGEWVVTNPGADVRGYLMPKFVMHGADLRRVIVNSKKPRPRDRQRFFNKDLAEPYAPGENMLSRAALLACSRADLRLHRPERDGAYLSDKPRTMGVDVAERRALNVRVSEWLDHYTKRMLWVGTLESFNDVGRYMEIFNVSMAAIDAAPNFRLAASIRDRYPGRVWLVQYRPDSRGAEVMRLDELDRVASVKRTDAIDATLDQFRTQKNLIPPLDELPEVYPAHLSSLVRVSEENDRGRPERHFYRKTGDDDYAHAEVFDLLAGELYWREVGVTEIEGAGLESARDELGLTPSALHEDAEGDLDYQEGPAEGY